MRTQIIAMCGLFVVVVSLVTWMVVSRSQEQVIQFEALKLAEVVANQAAVARSAYSRLAVTKLKRDGFGASEFSDDLAGHIPLPAQFLKELSRSSLQDTDGLFRFRPISKWNLAPEQGITDSFQEWAWSQLESQNVGEKGALVDWKPVWQIKDSNGARTLRYLSADPAASASCVNCHNQLEKRPDIIARRIADGVEPGHQWSLNELLGAIEITIPLDRVVSLAKEQTRDGLLIVAGISTIGVFGVFLIVFFDSASTYASTEKLSFQANHDSLTGLPNRLALETLLNKSTSESNSPAISVNLLFLDLDNFKQINDTLGHESGDQVLCMAAARIAESIPADGFVARLGGDEFAVVLHDKSAQFVERVARDIAHSIDQTYKVDNYKLAIGVSIGAAIYPVNATTTYELIRCADVAMYTAKNGKLTYANYDPKLDKNALSQLVMKEELREAIASGKLDIHYQPKYSLIDGKMTGLEALARWTSPSAGFVPPDVFIPLAERVGLIDELTALVLKGATQQCQSWRKMGYELSISVNLSAINLHDGTLVQLIQHTLADTGLPPSALILEVTEGAVMENASQACEVLSEVRALGVRFSVDDYGAGYSSLSYLNRLPISELKLDRAFIKDVCTSKKDAVIVAATLELARNLGLVMVAEGVEDAASLDFLTSIRCDQVQGYFLCRPLPALELERRLPFIFRFNPVPTGSAANDSESMSSHRRAA
ncbi:putative bifunctional diguanylate cyclase/phosphodiesterase [Granulosicoccus antarcticus]|uniref:Putative signaling protein n=1 Tax=Granulosicoccus antarcticus IMCC3135 TaxID=1192854 RepID=A0A2Z2P6J7_9GAMM|nr:EAL domain-containing protein [Granulosicoccus antarcticus]ASJ76317.1 putative signaling protein [Granulosicoccus antarcticus IMCC3135]